jgi:transposase-like protein
LTTGEVQAYLEQVYDVEVSRSLVARVTDNVAEEFEAWRSRPLDAIYAVVLIDCIYVKAGTGGEGAKHWLTRASLARASLARGRSSELTRRSPG